MASPPRAWLACAAFAAVLGGAVAYRARTVPSPPGALRAQDVATSPSPAKPYAVLDDRTAPITKEALPAAPTGSEDDALTRVRRAARAPAAEALAILERALDDPDDATRFEALDALVERRQVAALSRVIELDPVADTWLGPSIIAALGALGGAPEASARDRRSALDRLVALLRSEKERQGTDSAGYIVGIIEAIGALRHPDAAPILERELFDPFYDAADRTTIVHALGEIGQRRSLEPLAQLRKAAAGHVADDDFAREIDRELLATIDRVSRELDVSARAR